MHIKILKFLSYLMTKIVSRYKMNKIDLKFQETLSTDEHSMSNVCVHQLFKIAQTYLL